MSDPMTDPQAIAARLSEAQKRALLQNREPDGRGKWPVQNALIDKGLSMSFPWCLTPLGLAVRSILGGSND